MSTTDTATCEHERVDGLDGSQWCEDCGAELDDAGDDWHDDTDTCDLCDEPATQSFEQGGEWHTLCDVCERETRPAGVSVPC